MVPVKYLGVGVRVRLIEDEQVYNGVIVRRMLHCEIVEVLWDGDELVTPVRQDTIVIPYEIA